MKTKLLLFLFTITVAVTVQAQVYIDQFDSGVDENTDYGTGLSGVEANGEWTVTGDGSSGQYTLFSYNPADADGSPTTVDVTANNKVFVRVKASNLGTQFRMDLKDAAGFATTLPGFTKTLINNYAVLEFNFTDNLTDGGYGGTACATGPCPVDGTQISAFEFYINPVQGGFAGTVVLDYLSVGSQPSSGPMSDVFQDQFEDASSLNYMGSAGGGLENLVEDGNWIIRGNGTSAAWEPVNFLFHNTTSGDTTDVSVADGDDKVFVRMRSTIPGTLVRLDLMDVNDFATTGGSIGKVITDEFETYEYNFAGSYQDLAYGGTGCEPGTGPCPVDAERIANMIFFPDPGQEAYTGDVIIDYISVGTALEAVDPNSNILVYGDHFSDNADYVNTSASFQLEVAESVLSITGGGQDPPFQAVAYSLHDNDTGGLSVDATGNNKIFIKAKSSVANTLLRVDLVDTAGYVTSQPSFTRLLPDEFGVIELDFSAAYIDGGYGGTSCETGPCPVNGEAIQTVLLYPNAADGGFAGVIEIDYISFGAPMGDDIFLYSDQFDNGDKSQWSDAAGFTAEEVDGTMVLTGDGTAGPYAAFNFTPHDPDTNEPYILDFTSNNKFFMKAKSSVPNTAIRVDLVDSEGFVTTEPATVAFAGEEYTLLTYDFTANNYNDGGYGGTSCDMGPCPVDGSQIAAFLVYITPDAGGFDGTVTIDWVSALEPLEAVNDPGTGGPTGVEDYSDEFVDDAAFITNEQDGLAVAVAGGEFTISGDGTSGLYAPVLYQFHEGADSVAVNSLINNNKLFVRAKSSAATTELRIDMIDSKNFHTSQGDVRQPVSNDFEVLTFDFTGKYIDGGYGGTACETGPCPVDSERAAFIAFYLDPGVGAYDGDLVVDWIAFGEPLSVNVLDFDLAQSGNIYPNPVRGELYLDIETLKAGVLTATFTDVTGQVVSTQNLGHTASGKNSRTLTTTQLNQGMYFINITLDGKNAYNAKVVVK